MINSKNMGGQEPDSRYLVLWVCVIIASSIVVVGWLVSMKSNFNKINSEMNDNVGQNFQQAEQEVLSIFGDVNEAIKKESAGSELTADQVEAFGEIGAKVEDTVKAITTTEGKDSPQE